MKGDNMENQGNQGNQGNQENRHNDLNSILVEGVQTDSTYVFGEKGGKSISTWTMGVRVGHKEREDFTCIVTAYGLLADRCNDSLVDGSGVRVVGRIFASTDGLRIYAEHIEFKAGTPSKARKTEPIPKPEPGKGMTLAEAKALKPGDTVYSTSATGWKARVTSIRTWKRDPGRVEVHVKHGLRGFYVFDERALWKIRTAE
jgi:hypothetical protein